MEKRAQHPAKIPTVFTKAEVRRLLDNLHGNEWLMASLLYGAGMRLMECLRLQVKNVDFTYRQLWIREGKGAVDRVTVLPDVLIDPLHAQIAAARKLQR